MNFKTEFRQIIIPLLKGSPVLVLLMVAAVMIVRRSVTYMTPEYRAGGAIKINNLNYSQAGFGLYAKEEGSIPKQNENFLTEVEIFKSRDLIETTLRRLNWELTVYRVGQIRLVELMEENPLVIEYRDVPESQRNKLFFLEYRGDSTFSLSTHQNEKADILKMTAGREIQHAGLRLSVKIKDDFLQSKPNSLQPGDRFAFKINNISTLVSQFGGAKLFVKPVEKDVSIIRIYFNHELPEKAQQFVNALMQTYIEEGLVSKENQANATLAYLGKQLDSVAQKLYRAEADLAYYKSSHHMVDIDQETSTTLQEITQLDLQKVDLEMKISELDQLQQHLISGNNLSDFSPNYASLQDPIFRETYLKLQNFDIQREDLLQKYAPQNPAVTNLEAKSRDLKTFLNESVVSTLSNLRLKTQEVERNMDELNGKIRQFPDKDRRLAMLQRDVQLNEATYNFLMSKRTELAINKSSNLNPHRIIEHAERPTAVASPNKPLLYGLGIFLALVIGMTFSYGWHFLMARVTDKEDIISAISAPLIGVIYKAGKNQAAGFDQISGLMVGLKTLPPAEVGKGQLFAVSSLLPGEGKTYTSVQIAKGFAAAGHKTLLIDLDVRKPDLHRVLDQPNQAGFGDFLEQRVGLAETIQTTAQEHLSLVPAGQFQSGNYALLFSRQSLDALDTLRSQYEMVIVDTTAAELFKDNLPLMRHTTANLFVIRSGVTKRRSLPQVSRILEDFQLPNLHIILNGAADKKANRRMRKAYQNKKRVVAPVLQG